MLKPSTPAPDNEDSEDSAVCDAGEADRKSEDSGYTMTDPRMRTTPIPGLLLIDLPVHADSRGWFKENWQREKMIAAGLPDFGPVQNNISFNAEPGVTRGIHAEPWDKFISVATGRVFGAWVDLRSGENFGAAFWHEITPDLAVFVPHGVGNAFQTLEADTAYTYLVNDHWSPTAVEGYSFLNLADDTAAIPWPIPLPSAELSDKDRDHPYLAEAVPRMPNPTGAEVAVADPVTAGAGGERILVIGAGGQVGRALSAVWSARSDVDVVARDRLDIADADSVAAFDFSSYSVIVNAAGFTAVDDAETITGRRRAWAVNATGVGRLAAAARAQQALFVHLSSDYVFDGTVKSHTEDEELSPINVYGQSKAAGDELAGTADDHYIVRTSWVIGDGRNFVATMARLARDGVEPLVVDDQFGRLSFAADIAAAIDHLISTRPASGVYNVTNSGRPASWAEIATEVFTLMGRQPGAVTQVSTETYAVGRAEQAPRPRFSTLDLSKICDAGFAPADQFVRLREYLAPSALGILTQEP